MSELDKIRERIRKLLALADNNPSPEEAALAASKASELALEYGLEIDRIREERGEKPLPPEWFYMDEEALSDPHSWVGQLGQAVCEANGCRFIFVDCGPIGWKLAGVGRKDAQDIVRLTYAYISESLRRTQRKYIMKAQLGSAKARREYRYAYRMGYSMTVAKRITAWADGLRAQESKNALVLYRGDQLTVVDEFLKNGDRKINEVNHPLKPIKADAYMAGVKDGQEVSVNRQMEATKRAPQELLR